MATVTKDHKLGDLKQNLFIFTCLRKFEVQKWFSCGLHEVFALLAAAVGQFVSRLFQALEAAGVSWFPAHLVQPLLVLSLLLP